MRGLAAQVRIVASLPCYKHRTQVYNPAPSLSLYYNIFFILAAQVRIVASLPCYTPGTVDAQRGAGVFGRSIAGLQALNGVGYGRPGSGLELDLVYNPGGPFLAPDQATLEVGAPAALSLRCASPARGYAQAIHVSGHARIVRLRKTLCPQHWLLSSIRKAQGL